MADVRKSITQGEMAVESAANVCISTLLGSCVACCLWDPVRRVGGLNHMLLAGRSTDRTASQLAGINEMELLVNAMIKQGAARDRLVGKVFGGARMVSGLSNVGEANGRFTLEYLEREGIPCLSHSLGGESARHLLFWPESGVARQKFARDTPLPEESAPVRMPVVPQGNGVDLF